MNYAFYICVTSVPVLLIFWIRNEYVFNVRLKLLAQDLEQYEKLPSYNKMMLQVWKWNYILKGNVGDKST